MPNGLLGQHVASFALPILTDGKLYFITWREDLLGGLELLRTPFMSLSSPIRTKESRLERWKYNEKKK